MNTKDPEGCCLLVSGQSLAPSQTNTVSTLMSEVSGTFVRDTLVSQDTNARQTRELTLSKRTDENIEEKDRAQLEELE